MFASVFFFFSPSIHVPGLRTKLGLGSDTPTGKGVLVAIIDTGVDRTHPDLVGAIHPDSCDCAPGRDEIDDVVGHGTHIAGIVAGRGRKLEIHRGVAPDSQILVLNASNGPKSLSKVALLRAVEIAEDLGADIINLSAGQRGMRGDGSSLDPPWVWSTTWALDQFFAEAASRGVLSVIAAGNDGPRAGTVGLPGGLRNVLTVGQITDGHAIVLHSARGPFVTDESLGKDDVRSASDYHSYERSQLHELEKPDLVTFGEVHSLRRREARDRCVIDPEILRTGFYEQMSGTSQAAAVVSGLAACAIEWTREEGIDLGVLPGLTIKVLLEDAAARISGCGPNDCGRGFVDWSHLHQTLHSFKSDADYHDSVVTRAASL